MDTKLTPEMIDAMPAGRELDARILVAIFGWRWLTRKKTDLCALFPPHDAGEEDWQMAPWPEVESDLFLPVNHWPIAGERFTDWGRCCLRRKGKQTEIGMPSPSSDPRAMMEVKAALFKNHFRVETFWYVSYNGKENVVYAGAQHHDCGPHKPWNFCAAAEMGDDPGAAEALCVCRVALHAANSKAWTAKEGTTP